MSEDTPLNQNLSEYHKAIESEFSTNEPNTPSDLARAKLSDLLSIATSTLQSLLISAESETVQMSAVKLVFDYTLGKPTGSANEDDLTTLINTLTAKKPSTPSTPKTT